MVAKSHQPAVLIALGATFLLWHQRANARFDPLPTIVTDSPDAGWDGVFDPGWDDLPGDDAPLPTGEDMSPIKAFLYAVRRCEHTSADVVRGLDFFTFYGGSRFNDFSDHPANTGEKQGVPLPPEYCAAAGLRAGCVSTAAGALQINKITWDRIRRKHPYLPDFTPVNQLEAGRRLMAERGADLLVLDGRITDAFYRMAPIWASLPKSASTQPQKTMAQVLEFYDAGLGMA